MLWLSPLFQQIMISKGAGIRSKDQRSIYEHRRKIPGNPHEIKPFMDFYDCMK